jgi:hypothetical protein
VNPAIYCNVSASGRKYARKGWCDISTGKKFLRVASGVLVAILFAMPVATAEEQTDVLSPGLQSLWRHLRNSLQTLNSALFTVGDLKGAVRVKKVQYRFITATDVVAQVDENARGWFVTGMKALLADGTAEGTVSVANRPDGTTNTSVDLLFKDIMLEKIAVMAGFTPYTGKVKGILKVEVRGSAEMGLSGEGSFYIYDADLAKVPAIVKIVGLLGAPSIRRTRFDAAEAHFTMTPKRAVFQSIDISASDGSVTISAKRNGAITYDGQLDFIVEPIIEARFLTGLKLAGEFASTVLEAVEGRAARIRVEGTVNSPSVSWSPHR